MRGPIALQFVGDRLPRLTTAYVFEEILKDALEAPAIFDSQRFQLWICALAAGIQLP